MRFFVMALGLLVFGMPLAAFATRSDSARTSRVDCDRGQSVARALARAREGDTLLVKGTCRESLILEKPVTLDGMGTASIGPADPAETTFTVTGKDVVVRGFSLEAPALFQFFVIEDAKLSIEFNTIRNARNFGISVAGTSSLAVLGNTISDNGLGGIIALGGAEVAIGMRTGFDPAQPNTISNNGQFGIVLTDGAGLRLFGGNTISQHQIGVALTDGSNARIAGNVIDANDIGILVNDAANAQLPLAANPVPAFTALNRGTNVRFGIACRGGAIQGVPDGLAPAVRLPPVAGVLAGPRDGLPTFCQDQTETLMQSEPQG